MNVFDILNVYAVCRFSVSMFMLDICTVMQNILIFCSILFPGTHCMGPI